MKYQVSALNMNDGSYNIMGEFTSAKKATKFAEDLAETGLREINVIDTLTNKIIGVYNF